MKKMQLTLTFIISTILVLQSCKSNKKEIAATNIIPYALMIEADLIKLDSTPVAVMQYILDTLGNVMDSSIITKEEFKKVSKVFTLPNITSKELAGKYKETSYVDEFTKSYNFNYTPINSDLPIKNVLVSTSIGDNSKFKSVSISKLYKEKENSIQEQLYWKNNAYCLISKMISAPNTTTTFSTKKIVWGF
jgi:hypothetical protein